MNPAKVPLSAVRKFIHVRFMDKATLARLAPKGSSIREDVRREVQQYLSSLK
jgi:ribosomal protein S12